MKKIFAWLLFSIFIISGRGSFAQVTKSLTFSQIYDENAFSNYQKIPDYVSQLGWSLGKDIDQDYSSISLSYDGSLNIFKNFSDRNYHEHAVNFLWTLQLNKREEGEETEKPDTTEELGPEKGEAAADSASSDSTTNYFYAGSTLSARFDKAAYDYYDNFYGNGYAITRYSFSQSVIGRARYALGYRNYFHLSELNNLENAVLLALSSQMDQTTLIFEAGGGYKKYFSTTTDTTTFIRMFGGFGSGGGRRGKVGGIIQPPTQGPGGGFKRGSVVTQVGTPGTAQLTFALGFIEQVSRESSLGAKYLRRTSPSIKARYVTGQAKGYTTNDEIYDDTYGYMSNEFSGFFKQAFPWRLTLTIEPKYFSKTYGRPAYDLPTTDSLGNQILKQIANQRQDNLFTLTIGVEKQFKFTSGLAQNLTVTITYFYLNNQSNDVYNKFSNQSVTVGFAADF